MGIFFILLLLLTAALALNMFGGEKGNESTNDDDFIN
jgi:hypothetical protein